MQPDDTEQDPKTSAFARQPKTTGLHHVIGKGIKSFRAERQWRQIDLATHTGDVLTRATIANIEAGNRRVDLDELFPLCLALEVTLAQLIERGSGKVILYETSESHANMPVQRETLMSVMFGSTASNHSTTYADLVANINESARQIAREESSAVARRVVNERLREFFSTMREAVTDDSSERPW